MKTNELISNLTKNLKPVQQIHNQNKSFFFLLSIVIFFSILLIFFLSDRFQFLHMPINKNELGILILLFLFSLFYFIQISTPTNSVLFYSLPILALSYFSFLVYRFFFPANSFIEYEYHGCFKDFLLFYSSFFILNLIILLRRFTTEILKASIISGFLETSASSICLLILCPYEDAKHLIEYHFTVMLIGILISTIMKYYSLKFYFRKKLSFY